ncbi:Lrp/AsnC family transcriptional regulator [Serratia sp. NPDC078593]|uniref:Lrp/AsnC family transcriptional regulator n=1 Tax=unclassified Serratia (in: enterobacteria) TaxID=2647522 RepID=UPI0037D9122B
MYNIDDFDMKILTLLQANGRLTNQELSDLVGLSASQCSRRRISLEQAQLIRGYHARLAPEAVGLGLVGLIEVSLVSHAQQNIDSFHRMLEEIDAVIDAYKTTGDADYLLKVAVADLPALSDFISQTLSSHNSVSHIKTAVVLNRIKENGLLPVSR